MDASVAATNGRPEAEFVFTIGYSCHRLPTACVVVLAIDSVPGHPFLQSGSESHRQAQRLARCRTSLCPEPGRGCDSVSSGGARKRRNWGVSLGGGEAALA